MYALLFYSVGGTAQAREVVGVVRDEVLRATPRAPAPAARRVLALVRAGSLHHNPHHAHNSHHAHHQLREYTHTRTKRTTKTIIP